MNDNKTNILIYGSCVTRDIFRVVPNNIRVVDYFARSSLISLASKPITIEEDELELDSPFQRKMVIRDANKILLSCLSDMDFDFFLVDFIDERFDLVKIHDSILTKSVELAKSNFLKSKEHKIIKRDDLPLEMWEEACDFFAAKVLQFIPVERIIIIKGYWASKYKDVKGNILQFNTSYKNKALNQNRYLGQYYAYLENKLDGCHVVSADSLLADESHKWKISPFHYVDDWYHDAFNQLGKIFGRVNNSSSTE